MEKPFSAYKGDQPYIFVCYAHEDSAIVYPEIQWLHEQGVKIWYDEGISAGRIWRKEIAEAIQGASKFLYYVSKAALASDHCNREVDYALDKAFDVVPVFLEETQLTPELDLALNRVQALHRKNDASYQPHLLDAVGGISVVEPQSVASKKKLTMPMFAGLAVLVAVLLAWAGVSFFGNNTSDTKMRSIAVLPLENLSGDPDEEFFSDGTTDMLIQELRKIRSLRIISRQSVMQYKKSAETAGNIAEALNVDGLLTGTVIQTPELVRFTLQLYDARSDRIIWAESLDRSPTHILTLQAEIARAVSQQINIELTGSEVATLSISREVDPESHKAYLRGRFHVSQGNYEAAGAAFELATKLDPSNPDPFAELARLASIDVWIGTPVQELLPAIRRYNDHALALDPDHPQAQAEQALLLWYVDRKYQQAIDKFAELLNARPNNLYVLLYYSFVMETFDRLDLAVQLYSRIIELEPTNAAQIHDRGQIYQRMGDYDKALASFERAEQLGFPIPVLLASLALDQGDRKNLVVQLQRKWGGSDAAIHDPAGRHDWGYWRPVFEAELAKQDGDMQRMRTIIQPYDKEEGAGTWRLRHNYPLMLGETERAVDFYSKALDNGEPVAFIKALGGIGKHERYPEFFSHPKYQEMLRANGLDAASIATLNIPPFPF